MTDDRSAEGEREAPHECLQNASFCLAVTGEGAYAEIVHGGWPALLRAFALALWTDGDTSHDPEQWAEWVADLGDTDEWLHDEANEPSSWGSELGETAHVSIYRLASTSPAGEVALPEPSASMDSGEFGRMCNLIGTITKAETNGAALGAIADFRLATIKADRARCAQALKARPAEGAAQREGAPDGMSAEDWAAYLQQRRDFENRSAVPPAAPAAALSDEQIGSREAVSSIFAEIERLLIGVDQATDEHGEVNWYESGGIIQIDSRGVAKPDADLIAYLSPQRLRMMMAAVAQALNDRLAAEAPTASSLTDERISEIFRQVRGLMRSGSAQFWQVDIAIARALLAAASPAALQWISVSERRPDDGERLLVWHEAWGEHADQPYLASYHRVLGFTDIRRGRACSGVTHWMPLPKPPGAPQ